MEKMRRDVISSSLADKAKMPRTEEAKKLELADLFVQFAALGVGLAASVLAFVGERIGQFFRSFSY